MGKLIDGIVAGSICLDVIPAFQNTAPASMAELFVPGKLINMGSAAFSTGGPVSNTGIAMQILGADVQLMGKIGNDFFGNAVLKLLQDRGLEKTMTVVDGEQTAYSIVIVPPGFDRIFLHHTGANDTFCYEDIDFDKVAEAKLFHFGYPPLMRHMYEKDGEELVRIFRAAKEAGATTSLDMSLPDKNSDSGKADWKGILQKLLPYVDIYLPSIEESLYMVAREDYEVLQRQTGGDLLQGLDLNKMQEIGSILMDYGAKIVVLKCGVMGYYVRTADKHTLQKMGRLKPADLDNWASRELHEESYHVEKVVSATGSGDSSIAGFLTSLLKGKSIEFTLKAATCVGAQNVQVFDALSNIHSWEETEKMLEGWEKNRHKIPGGYWTYNETMQTWVGKMDKNKA